MTKRTDMVMAAGVAFAAALIGLAPAARADRTRSVPGPVRRQRAQQHLDPHGGRLFGHQRSDPGRRLRRERRLASKGVSEVFYFRHVHRADGRFVTRANVDRQPRFAVAFRTTPLVTWPWAWITRWLPVGLGSPDARPPCPRCAFGVGV